MQKQISLFLFFFLALGSIEAQHNYIFNGSNGDGFAFERISMISNHMIFNGADNDGYDTAIKQSDQNEYIFGGFGDGFGTARQSSVANNSIFFGGMKDGWGSYRFAQKSNHPVFSGGLGDGWTEQRTGSLSNNLVFSGGKDDGFDQSGISKMVWTGALSNEWLMAGNWYPIQVPGHGDAACIAKVDTHYPLIKEGSLSVKYYENSTYTCRSLYIAQGAEVTISDQAAVFTKGKIQVYGLLKFEHLGFSTCYFVLREAAELTVFSGGALIMGQ